MRVCIPTHVEDRVMGWGMDFSVCHSKIKFSRMAIGKSSSQNPENLLQTAWDFSIYKHYCKVCLI